MENILQEIRDERLRQDTKWGIQNRPCLDQALLNREGGCTSERMCEEYEVPTEDRAKFLCTKAFLNKTGTYAHIAVEEMSEVISAFDINERRVELVQLAAVCVAWLEKIDRDLTKSL